MATGAWKHVLDEHPYLNVQPEAILSAVADPDRRLPGREVGEEWFYRRGVGPSVWMKVAVHYESGIGRIVTAFPRRDFP